MGDSADVDVAGGVDVVHRESVHRTTTTRAFHRCRVFATPRRRIADCRCIPARLDRAIATIIRSISRASSRAIRSIRGAIMRSRDHEGRVPKVVEARALLSGRQPATNCGSSAATLVVPPPTASPSKGGLALCTRLARTDYGCPRCPSFSLSLSISLSRFRDRDPALGLSSRPTPATSPAPARNRDQGRRPLCVPARNFFRPAAHRAANLASEKLIILPPRRATRRPGERNANFQKLIRGDDRICWLGAMGIRRFLFLFLACFSSLSLYLSRHNGARYTERQNI